MERGMADLQRALGKLRQEFNVGFMKEQMTRGETRDYMQALDPQTRMDMMNALGPDTFFEQLDKIGLLDEETEDA